MKNLIPVTLLTGYLGAGKTTLLNYVLNNQKGYKVAVIVNDIGEVNIDASLIQKGGSVIEKDDVMPLQNGCICCTLKTDLMNQIISIAKQKKFDYILIEASGICEPIPIAQTIEALEGKMGDRSLPAVCRLDNIVAVVDASRLVQEFGSGQALLKQAQEDDIENLLVQQIEFCNTVLINKTDLVKKEELDMVKAVVKKLQPQAKMIETVKGQVDLKQILNTGSFSFEKVYQSAGWLNELNKDESEDSEIHNEDSGETEEYGISTFVFNSRKPFDRAKLDYFAAKWPKGVIRSKGIVWFSDDNDSAYILEQAGKQITASFYGQWMATAPKLQIKRLLERDADFAKNWDDVVGDRCNKLVFIGKNMNKAQIKDALQKCCTEPDL